MAPGGTTNGDVPGSTGRRNDDIELALAASEGELAFELSPHAEADPATGMSTSTQSERQRLTGGGLSSSGDRYGLNMLRQGAGAAPGPGPGGWPKWKWVAACFGGVLVLLVVLAGIAALGGGGGRSSPDLSHATYARFQIIGDWGRQGLHNQSDVAAVMGAVAHDAKPDFVISTGDNFYESGLTSVADDLFRASYSEVYSAASLKGVPWYAVLGNHDYGETGPVSIRKPANCPALAPDCVYGPLPQLDVALRKRDPRWHCGRNFRMPLAGGRAEVFFYDTSPFILSYHNASWAGQLGGIAEQSWRGNLKELEAALADSTAAWKLVVGHHPVLSSGGAHGDQSELQQHVQPVLEKYGVQAYFSGHDHHLEHLRVPGTASPDYIISGAGSQVRPVREGEEASQFKYYGSGFVEALLKAEEMQLRLFGVTDDNHLPIYVTSIPRTPPRHGRRRSRQLLKEL
mmetsp:Transcript_6545/g.18880  ORF Transcript_6545/g.18880 Transcript_6545/m.18880 type:complete len:458 (+) Transcript_6545:514-1887(+)|eukprot:CAMPEP_0206138496 /NCGR_PEP_ID=MMETSP1473-20131121/3363_1 /ASSEMBLY_ACC=CAM_ASM_001109 /TAXON_ID=1461547 /ORGANISM="Stichococcus sp, Strain RCC1054" /LENGTH=457 /DNA_ID=CAMNT_0053531949 /DNA_START=457 /DNA_END=1830 /DNA_ORIENTATION=+